MCDGAQQVPQPPLQQRPRPPAPQQPGQVLAGDAMQLAGNAGAPGGGLGGDGGGGFRISDADFMDAMRDITGACAPQHVNRCLLPKGCALLMYAQCA